MRTSTQESLKSDRPNGASDTNITTNSLKLAMKSNKKSATIPSTEGSNTTPQRQEGLTEVADKGKKNVDNVSDGEGDYEDDDEM